MSSVPKISEAEWVVMQVIWNWYPIAANEVVEALAGSTEWSPRTIRTLINRLYEKGALDRTKRDGIFHYTPAIEESACIEAESESFLKRFFGGSLNPLVAYFLENGKLSPEEIEDLRKRFSSKGE